MTASRRDVVATAGARDTCHWEGDKQVSELPHSV